MKKVYYKTVSDDYPGGVFSESRADALDFASAERDGGGKVYVRKVVMDEELFNSLGEI